MGNEFRDQPGHSAEYFGDTRDHWWNEDFLGLMAQRWRLDDVRTVLDVGAGVGHWGMLLAKVLPPEARVTGVDREPTWVAEANRRAVARGLGARFSYVEGTAEQLPFADDTFDLVTCQTVLIHTPDPFAVLGEMIRVVRPSGLVAVAEPNNLASALALDSVRFDAPIDEVLGFARFQLVCERGKQALGLGHNSIGEQVPAMFARHGLEDVRVVLNDKAATLAPPYVGAAEEALADEIRDLAAREIGIWSHDETRRYYLAGGGDEASFEDHWAAAVARRRQDAAALEAGTYACAGGGIGYLISGRKPER
jgi:SAM-dependent methyltransferase